MFVYEGEGQVFIVRTWNSDYYLDIEEGVVEICGVLSREEGKREYLFW